MVERCWLVVVDGPIVVVDASGMIVVWLAASAVGKAGREGDRDRERDLDRCDALSLKRSSSVSFRSSMDCISL